jgi:hypothetical protein
LEISAKFGDRSVHLRASWRDFPPSVGTLAQTCQGTGNAIQALSGTRKDFDMIGKLIGALVGERIAGPNNKAAGALVGAAVPVIARRGLGTLGLALAAGWGAKKLIERRRKRRDNAA